MSRAITLFGVALLAGAFGYGLGRNIGINEHYQAPSLSLQQDTRDKVPTVVLKRLRNSELQGQMHADVRLFVGEDLVQPEADGTFSISAGPLLTNEIVIDVPDGMHFVASKNGTKYYPVDSSSAARIVPENRVYFKTEWEAAEAGFRRWK